jgi:hypothetical protein
VILAATALSAFLATLSPDARAHLAIRARAQLAVLAAEHGDVLGWGQAVMPDKFRLPFCPLHRYIVEHRGEAITSLKAPRGFGKSILGCMLVPLYQGLAEPHKPFGCYLNVGATDTRALATNRAIKQELEDNAILRHLYGIQVGTRWTDSEMQLRNGVVYMAAGAGVAIRGINFENRRPDFVVADDLFGDAEIFNRDATIRINEWAKGNLFKTLARDRRTAFHVQGTMIHRDDLLSEMGKWPGCVSKTFQAIQKDGSSLWPALYSPAQLEEERVRLGSVIFNREMQNICSDDSESIVKSGWLSGWLYDPAVRWAKGFTRDFSHVTTIIGMDPSVGQNESNDYTGAVLVVITGSAGSSRHDFWIEQLHEARLTMEERISLLRRMQAQQLAFAAAPLVNEVRIESIGAFLDMAAEVRRRTSLPVREIKSVKNKLATLENRSGHFERGSVHISSAIDPVLRERLVEELLHNKPLHDDARDALLLTLDDPTSAPDMRAWIG